MLQSSKIMAFVATADRVRPDGHGVSLLCGAVVRGLTVAAPAGGRSAQELIRTSARGRRG